MGIGRILKNLRRSDLEKAWRLAHALSEARGMDEMAEVLLHQTRPLVPHDTGVVIPFDPLTRIPIPDSIVTKNIQHSEESIERYNSYYYQFDPVLRVAGDPRYFNRFVSDSDLIDKKTLMNSEYYTDFFRPAGLHHALAMHVTVFGKPVGMLGIHRPPGSRDFTEREKAAMTLAAPAIAASFFTTALADGLYASNAIGPLPSMKSSGLTAREDEIVSLVVLGLSNMEIGERLNISVRTVKVHMNSILKKTGARNRVALISSLIVRR